MGFYFNNQNKIINLNEKKYYMNLVSLKASENNAFLLDTNNQFLYSSDGLKLVAKSYPNEISI